MALPCLEPRLGLRSLDTSPQLGMSSWSDPGGDALLKVRFRLNELMQLLSWPRLKPGD